MKRELPILFFVNCERTVLFSVKRDLDPPFTTLMKEVSNDNFFKYLLRERGTFHFIYRYSIQFIKEAHTFLSDLKKYST